MNEVGNAANDRPRAKDTAALIRADGMVLHRAGCFAWLAELFSSPPSLEVVRSYRGGRAHAWLQDVGDDVNLEATVQALHAVLSLPCDDGELTSLIGASYGKLFLGIGGPHTVPPYESAHRCGNRLFQLPVAEMQALLDVHGLVVGTECAEPPDHLAIELALLSRLIFSGHPDQAALVSRLQRWAPSFAARCAEQDELGFWAAAAALLIGVLNRENCGSVCRDEPNNTRGGLDADRLESRISC